MRLLIIALTVFALAGCEYAAVQSAPKKEASASRTPAALEADKLFWATLHGGNYAGIGKALEANTAAYLENPNDAVTAAHVGWLHMWRLAERSRLDAVPPTMTDDAVLARKYFQEAVALNPGEARYLGFLAAAMLAEGSIHKDEKLLRQGHFRMLEAVKAWPEFNLFTAGVGASRLPPDSPHFKEALDNQWRALDLCAGEKVESRATRIRHQQFHRIGQGHVRDHDELSDRRFPHRLRRVIDQIDHHAFEMLGIDEHLRQISRQVNL